MRTEWAHFSTIFIGEGKGSVVVCGAALRAPCDREVLKSKMVADLDRNGALQFNPDSLVRIKKTTIRERLTELGLCSECAKREAELGPAEQAASIEDAPV